MSKDLSEKRKRFVDEYLIDLNATQAYIRAGYKSKKPDVDCHKILGNSRVQDYIHTQMAVRAKRTAISQDRVLEELARIAYSDIKDFLSYWTEKVNTGKNDGAGNPIYVYKQIVELKPSSAVDGAIISEIILSKDGTLRFKLHDKLTALEKLGKHLGMFIDRLNAQPASRSSDISEVITAQEIMALPEDQRNTYIDQLAEIAKGE